MKSKPVTRALGRVLLAVSLAALLAVRAEGTVLVPADLAELVTSAVTIAHGRVVATAAQWREGRRGIETLVTIEVEDSLKGGAVSEITFRVPGGRMGPYRSFMPGAPSFAEGDEVIVFLGGVSPEVPHLVGFSQGVYRVQTQPGGRFVRAGVPLAAPGSEGTVIRGAPSRRSMALDAFESEVRSIVRGGVR